jgi:hypothetical protein
MDAMSTGTPAERSLMGAILDDQHNAFRAIDGLITGNDFTDARMGEVFDQLARMEAQGEVIEPIVVQNRMMQDWGIRGLHEEVWVWNSASVSWYAAAEYAQAVKSAAVARAIRNVMTVGSDALNSGDDPATVSTAMGRQLSEINATAGGRGMPRRKLGAVIEEQDEYDWLVPGYLERKDRLIVTAGEGVGKTTFLRQIIVLAAAGINPFTFEPMQPINALVIDAENTERQWRRGTQWMMRQAALEGQRDPGQHIDLVAGKRVNLLKGPDLLRIHQAIDETRPDIILIGPIYKLVSDSIYSDAEVAPLIVALDSIRDRGLTMVMEAHTPKAEGASGYRDLRPRGSAALLGWPEFGLGLSPRQDSDNHVDLIRWRGDRDERPWPSVMKRGGYRWPWEASF